LRVGGVEELLEVLDAHLLGDDRIDGLFDLIQPGVDVVQRGGLLCVPDLRTSTPCGLASFWVCCDSFWCPEKENVGSVFTVFILL
jgi:hypothetical protein